MKLVRTAMGEPAIARMEAMWAATCIGTWAFNILLSIYAFGEGGAAAVGLAVLVSTLPAAIAAPYTALLVDRHSRSRVLLASLCARVLLAAAAGLAALAELPFAVVLVPAALFKVAATAHRPAQAALLPQIARSPGILAAANACWSSIEYGGFLFGSLAAGALAGLLGAELGLLLAAAPLCLAVVVMLGVPRDSRPPALEGEPPTSPLRELSAGLRIVASDPSLRRLVGWYGGIALNQSMRDIAIVILAIEILDMGEAGVGWLGAAEGVGGVLGGLAAIMLIGRGRLVILFVGAALAFGLPVAMVAGLPYPAVALVLLLVVGIGEALLESVLNIMTQRIAADDTIGRVYGVEEALYAVAVAIGGVVLAGIDQLIGGHGALVVTGLLLPVAALISWRQLASFEVAARVPEDAFERLRGTTVFAPLPVASIENLAIRAQHEHHAAKSTIVTQGEAGERFYVIDGGRVEVLVDGRHRRFRAEGEFFGEVALLRDVPRIATVCADTDVHLLVLEREEFLTAIGSNPRSGGIAERAAAARLRGAAD